MTVAGPAALVSGLGVVMGAMLLVYALLRRLGVARPRARGRLPMEVVQRLALGPKQGLAVVRIGERLVTVSLGEGGVRPVLELGEAEMEVVRAAEAAAAEEAPAPLTLAALVPSRAALRGGMERGLLAAALHAVRPRATVEDGDSAPQACEGADFAARLRAALRTAAVVALVVGAGMAARPAAAQAAPPTPQAGAAEVATPAPAPSTRTMPAVLRPGQGTAKVDSALKRLVPQMDVKVGGEAGSGLRLSGTVGVVVMMGMLSLLPAMVLMMTGFTRILIVLHFLRQALGTQGSPPAHLIGALALLLTGFVMGPTLNEANRTAFQPWMEGRMDEAQMLATGAKPFRAFMVRQTRERDIALFVELSHSRPPATVDDVPLVVLASAFATSELRTAFQIGFVLFLPFIVIDVVVSSVLMSMGMVMLPPAMISLPFKLLLFVLVDGWALVVQSLVTSFR
ncbi:MAG: flagellar type III secretion system pore protein FliP [Gemmatimonadetes bacterium]|nr:flagellar type III secretion system pore protein FliP [Gemmatimonadota bacterium]